MLNKTEIILTSYAIALARVASGEKSPKLLKMVSGLAKKIEAIKKKGC